MLSQAHVATGEALVADGHYAHDDITTRLAQTFAQEAAVEDLWQQQDVDFKQLRDVRAWEQEYGMLVGWLSRQEAFLESTDVGDSVETVESLIKYVRPTWCYQCSGVLVYLSSSFFHV